MDAFHNNFIAHGEIGAALAVFVEGRPVIHIWAGSKNRNADELWQEDTLVNVFSATKGILSCCLLRLVEQGKICLNSSVASYWPEFAAHGKDSVLVSQVLHHVSGLPALHHEISSEDLYNFDKMTAHCAQDFLWAQAGEQLIYSPFTFGWIVGELIRRVSGKTPGQYFRQEIADKFQLDFYIGLPDSELARVADLQPLAVSSILGLKEIKAPFKASEMTTLLQQDNQGVVTKAFTNPSNLLSKTNSLLWRQSEIPAANGQGTAYSLAKMYSLLATAGAQTETDLLSGNTVALCSQPQVSDVDLLSKQHVKFSHGFKVSLLAQLQNYVALPNEMLEGCFGHAGAGGSIGFADQKNKIGFAYVTRSVSDAIFQLDSRACRIIGAFYTTLIHD